MEAIIESVDEFYSENLAQEVTRGMREAASRGFWISGHAPYGYNRVMVQDGPKKRPALEIEPDASRIVKRMFDMAEAGNGTLEIIRTLNNEGIACPRGKLWGRTSVHGILTNEAYTGTLIWGVNAKDQAEPVRVEKAFPAIVTKAQFRRVGKHLSSRAPKFNNPRRVGSSYLLSGLVKCKTCNTPLTGRFAKSGQYSYYVCQSNIKLGKDACETPRLNARHFEEMDGVAREQRKTLRNIETELSDVRRRLDTIYNLVETTPVNMADFTPRIRQHRERQERLEYSAEQARAALAQRRKVLDEVNTIAAYAKDMRDFLKEIVVMPGDALLRYTVPMPDDSLIPGRAAEKVGLSGPVLSTMHDGGPKWTVDRTEFEPLRVDQRRPLPRNAPLNGEPLAPAGARPSQPANRERRGAQGKSRTDSSSSLTFISGVINLASTSAENCEGFSPSPSVLPKTLFATLNTTPRAPFADPFGRIAPSRATFSLSTAFSTRVPRSPTSASRTSSSRRYDSKEWRSSTYADALECGDGL